MPGLSQLKQFNKDIQSLGDELTIRASRGEKPVRVPIPKGIEDRDDSADFELGMPENAAPVEDSSVDDDLSEITGIPAGGSNSTESDTNASFEAPDMSSILNPVISDSAMDSGMPDLSMFMDAPQADSGDLGESEVIEEEPEEISVADMGLEALLSGAGFDGSEGTGQEEETQSDDEDDFYSDDTSSKASDEPDDLDTLEEKPEPVKPAAPRGPGDALDIDTLFGNPKPEPEPKPAAKPVEKPAPAPEPEIEAPEVIEDISEPETAEDNTAFSANMFSDLDDDDVNPFEEAPEVSEDVAEQPSEPDTSFEEPAASESDAPSENAFETDASDFNLDNLDIPDFPETESTENPESFETADGDESSGGELNPDDFEIPDFGDSSDSFESEASETPESADETIEPSETETPSDETGGLDSLDFGNSSSGFDLDSLDNIEFEDGNSHKEDNASDEVPDFSSDMTFGDAAGTDESDAGTETEKPETDLSDSDGFGTEGFGTEGFSSTDFDTDIPDRFDFNADSEGEDSEKEESGPVEVFSTEGMENFDLEDTDSKLSAASDDFGSDPGDFEIPGFSDVTAAKEEPKSKKAKLDTPDFSGALEGNELPPNTLSDAQYKKFLKNLNEYPLNVRLAFEDFIVQDEFTDDAEFEIIEKILNKAPARQVAANLEKMLDISIPVPRDFEHRSAEEYEAYKKSIAYQLKNRIIPFAIMGVVLLLLGWGLFNFTKNCIVIPIQANNLYKQGYALLEADEYPQSEVKFDQAASKRMKKNWFFKYARGYRDKKQYNRAGKMYRNILTYFNHDKEAGLEYAEMDLNDLADYSGAEEIVRREVLDYHADDSDAQLLLGDIYLEWGTEQDPEKLELAKNQYSNLLNEAKNSKLINLYESRMMRYYIRTDNLANVLPYKDMFEPKEKNLSAEDWTELSGYLLKKLYGPMAPSEEYLRAKIEGLRKLLQRAVSMDPDNPVALYNLGTYYVHNDEAMHVEGTFKMAIDSFNKAEHLKNRDIYKFIDSYRQLGENYVKTDDLLQAQESYSNGITLYTAEKESAGFAGNEDIGHLYSDLADLNYFASGDYDNAELNYENAVNLGYDNSKIRYRLGYMQYIKNNYQAALGSFIKAGEGNVKEDNLLLAMGNTLSLRNDDYAAEGYYSQLIRRLNNEVDIRGGSVYAQSDNASHELVSTYLYAANNYGVTLHRLAVRTGDSSKNAQAIVQFQQSERAWDALTRNQQTMVRLGGSNLAEENIKYITHPVSDFEPAIYLDIPKTLTDNESL